MPRAKSVSSDSSTQKTAKSRSSSRASTSKLTSRAKTTKTPAPRRKAPVTVRTSSGKSGALGNFKSTLILVVLFLVVVGTSAFIGMADDGQINVSGVIEERGESLRQEGKIDEANQLTVPKNETVRRPNGGLRGSGAPRAEENTNPVSSDTNATSTDLEGVSEADDTSATTDEDVSAVTEDTSTAEVATETPPDSLSVDGATDSSQADTVSPE